MDDKPKPRSVQLPLHRKPGTYSLAARSARMGLSPDVAAELARAQHDFFGAYGDIRRALADARSTEDFLAVAAEARKHTETARHADTIAAMAKATTRAVREALRDAYANAGDVQLLSAKLQEAMQHPEQSAADHVAVAAVVANLNARGITQLGRADVDKAYAQAPAPATDAHGLDAKVAEDLQHAASDFWSFSTFNDVRQALRDARSPEDFAAVAAAANKYAATKGHAPVIAAIGQAPNVQLRHLLRDAYADPRETDQVAFKLRAALNMADQSPQDQAAVTAVVTKLHDEHYTVLDANDLLRAYQKR